CTGRGDGMALYRFELKVIGRSGGRSAVAAAAYRSGTRMVCARRGQVFDYRRRKGVSSRELLAPPSAPAWARTDRQKLWQMVEASERRVDSRLAKEAVLSLPRELSVEDRVRLVRAFVEREIVALGLVADIAHHDGRTGKDDPDGGNPHAHVLISTRRVGPDGFEGKEKALDARDTLLHLREAWASHLNEALERAGAPTRVSHLSLAAQCEDAKAEAADARANGDTEKADEADAAVFVLDRKPEPKLGRGHHLRTRAGIQTDQGEAVDALRIERARRQTLTATLRTLLRKAAQFRLQLGDRLRQSLSEGAMASLRDTNLAVSVGRLARGEGERLTPDERIKAQERQRALRHEQAERRLALGDGEQASARERDLRREEIERHRIEQELLRVRAVMRRDRGRGIGR
ncbi:MobQ family relaxase, partial [Bradyrhizobium sp. 49]|uniref:MobQ family relaxase n=1 Tax=Bradyrhizobium sp. 49 TaxID=2782677 RepID=UPI001FFB77F2